MERACWSIRIKTAKSLKDLKLMMLAAEKDKTLDVFIDVLKTDFPIYYEIIEKYVALI